MDRAVALLCVGGAMSAISAIAGVFLLDPSDGWSFGAYSSSDQQHTAEVVGLVGAVFALPVTVGIWLWLAWANGKGKTWARTVTTVLAVVRGASFVPGVVLTTTAAPFGSYGPTRRSWWASVSRRSRSGSASGPCG
jgi:hypothetical protein